jgi:hypothetical protein
MIFSLYLGYRFVQGEEKKLGKVRTASEMQVQRLATLTAGIGLFAFFTNGESKLTDLPLWFVPLFVLMKAESRVRRGLVAYCTAVSLAGLTLGYTRHRVKGIGPDMFWEANGVELLASPPIFFKNFKAGPRFRQAIEEISTHLKTANLTGREVPVFFGPRIEFGYAAFGLPSPRGFPIFWWWGGVSYPIRDEGIVVERFKNYAPLLCFFYADDPKGYENFPPKIRDFLRERYTLVRGKVIDVYVLKSS